MSCIVVCRKCKMAQKIEEHRKVETFLEGVFAIAPQGLSIIHSCQVFRNGQNSPGIYAHVPAVPVDTKWYLCPDEFHKP